MARGAAPSSTPSIVVSVPMTLATRPNEPDPASAPGGPVGVDSRGTSYTLLDRGVLVEKGARRQLVPLDDPRDVSYLELPRIDLEDGRALRTAAFLVWAAHVRALVGTGHEFASAHRARKPYHTAFGVLGGLLVGLGVLGSLAYALGTPRRVWIEPSPLEWLFLLAAIGVLLSVSMAALSTAGRLWATRRGSHLQIGPQGVSFAHGAAPRPFSSIADVEWRSFIRCTEITTTDGARVVLPKESGPLVRPDLFLAALDDSLRDKVLRRV